jgi:hypothetical protein
LPSCAGCCVVKPVPVTAIEQVFTSGTSTLIAVIVENAAILNLNVEAAEKSEVVGTALIGTGFCFVKYAVVVLLVPPEQ